MLGIIVGTATIVMVVAIGNGGQAAVEEQFSKLNADIINVMSGRGDTQMISEEDLEYLLEESEYLKDASMFSSGNSTLSYGYEEYTGSGYGVEPNFLDMNNFTLAAGAFIADDQNDGRRKVVVLGSEAALELFGGDYRPDEFIGEDVTVSGKRYEVIGIMESNGKTIGFASADEGVFFPYSTFESYVAGNNAKPSIMAQAPSVDTTDLLNAEINALFNIKYLSTGGHSFMIRDAGSMLTAAKDSAEMLSILLTSVAVIVLIVGGIGIMNVLFVSVKERTREIGILKALGATRKVILLTFLLESVAISIIGAVIGILISVLIMPLMAYTALPALPSWDAFILALVFAVITGTFFGYYPALSASKLSPIEALRSE